MIAIAFASKRPRNGWRLGLSTVLCALTLGGCGWWQSGDEVITIIGREFPPPVPPPHYPGPIVIRGAAVAEDNLIGLGQNSDDLGEITCLGLDLIESDKLPADQGGFEERVIAELGDELYSRTPRGQLEEIHGLLVSIAAGDPDLIGIACAL